MAANNILPFGATASNELSDSAYAAEAQRLTGNQPGKASSKLNNKALHQTSLIAAGIAQFLADRQATDLTDTLTPANIAAMLVAVLTGPNLFTTPPQFDNDTSPATTAFVQKALGNFQVGQAITTPGNFLASDAGGSFSIQTAGTYGLPALAGLSVGASFSLQSTVSGAVVSRAGSDQFLLGSVLVNSITLNTGDTLTVSKIGSNWVAIAGTAASRGSAGDFGASLGASGYQKLPSGVICQWFNGTAGDNTTFINNPFPITFPNVVRAIVAMHTGSDPSVNIISGSSSTSGVNLKSSYTTSVACSVIVIGN